MRWCAVFDMRARLCVALLGLALAPALGGGSAQAGYVTSEIVFFPRENHNLTRTGEPKHLVESLNWQTYWFDRFLNGNESAKRPTD